MSRLVSVSNRVTVPRRSVTPGGLALGVHAAMQARGGLWFGWSGEVAEREPDAARIVIRDRIAYGTIELTQADHEQYYLGFCNGALWPLFHYFLDAVHYHDEQYHLIPLAQELRALGAQQPVGFFLHIPFPHVEALRALPVYGELMRALIDFDLVAFQTERDLECFRSAVVDLWGPEAIAADGGVVACGRRTCLDHIPIGVDVDAIQAAALAASSSEAVQRMVAGLVGRRCVIGVDRLDYSKGLVERFDAYARFLEEYPENQGRVTFLQIAPLSRTDVRAYAHLRRSLEQAAGRANGKYADTDWTPIRYLNRNYPHQCVLGFMRASQVGLVTPLRDGMNLVAKEFVAAQDPDDPGVLVLSTLAGAARELAGALLVNPKDTRGVARAIQQALQMRLPERRDRHQQMLEVLRRNDIAAWHTRFVERLQATHTPAPSALSTTRVTAKAS
ncbi:MAG: otsA [Steroidobacteraceae bacterium]|nr:otsA [Steroidobacteraceae bacterium]